MKFSVIVPVYKVEKYIEECINSVLLQSFEDFEVILVDDGSPDKSPEICDIFAKTDNRIRVIHKENGGLSDARNAGIRAAVGDYLLFLDSDDFWTSPYVLSKIASKLEETGATIVQFGHEVYLHHESRRVKGAMRTFANVHEKDFHETLYHLVSKGKLAISACSMAISRQFVLNHQLFFTKGLKTEDLEWSIRVFVFEPVFYCVEDYFYAYRTGHGGTITSSIDYNHLCDYCWIIETSVKRALECTGKMKEALMSYLMYHVLIASALCYRVYLEDGQRKKILLRLEAICENKITQYTLDKKVKLASIIYRIFGFSFMSKILGFYLNNRGR